LPQYPTINAGWIREKIEGSEDYEYKFVVFTLKPEYVYHLKAQYAVAAPQDSPDQEPTTVTKLLETEYTKSSYTFPMIWGKEFFNSVYSEYVNMKLFENVLSGVNVNMVDVGSLPMKRTVARTFKHNVKARYRQIYAHLKNIKNIVDINEDSEIREVLSRTEPIISNRTLEPGEMEEIEFGGISPIYQEGYRGEVDGEQRELSEQEQFQESFNSLMGPGTRPAKIKRIMNMPCLFKQDIGNFMGAINPRDPNAEDKSGLNISLTMPGYFTSKGEETGHEPARANFNFERPDRIQANLGYLYDAVTQYVMKVLKVENINPSETEHSRQTAEQMSMPDIFKQKNEREIAELTRLILAKLDRGREFGSARPVDVEGAMDMPEEEYIDPVSGHRRRRSSFEYLIALQKYLSALNELVPESLEVLNERILPVVNPSSWHKLKNKFSLKQLYKE